MEPQKKKEKKRSVRKLNSNTSPETKSQKNLSPRSDGETASSGQRSRISENIDPKRTTVKIISVPETVHYNTNSSPRDVGTISPRSPGRASTKSTLLPEKTFNDVNNLEELINLLDMSISPTTSEGLKK